MATNKDKQVLVKAAGTNNYLEASKTVTVKVIVK